MNQRLALLFVLMAALSLTACQPTIAVTPSVVTVNLLVDGETRQRTTEALLVRDVLAEAGVALGPLDGVQPSEFTPLSNGITITVTRVTEDFEVENVEVPFERQTVRNENLPEGESRLLQTGAAGLEEVTYRVVYEDGVQVSRSVVRRNIITQPVPEIIMVGVQSTFIAIPIDGRLAYLSAGNGWLMRDSSGSRRPLTITGDLDGRVFELSPSGDYLLFTRNTLPTEATPGEAPETFNRLWAVSTVNAEAEPVDLEIDNVLWAGWSTIDERTLAYTTGAPILDAPGWRANNELFLLTFTPSGSVDDPIEVLAPDDGGQFGGYGTVFTWAPNGRLLGFARGNTLGVVDLTQQRGEVLAEFTHYNTGAAWVWLPDLAFSRDSAALYAVLHGAPAALEAPEDSPVFDVVALATDGSFQAPLIQRAGMWAAPVPAPTNDRVAFLQAIQPLESVTGRYRLGIMDRDGSNISLLFPPAGETGLRPQQVAWSPDGERIALIRDGNLWVIDSRTGVAQQLTGDGQTSVPSWAD